MSKNPSTRLLGPSFLAMSAALFLAGAAAPAMARDATAEETAEAVPQASSIEAWGITDAELQADPEVTYGVLENGMRYALKRNTQPAGEASMRFLFDVGTRDERDDEEGAAHFIEHMAFNGSTNFAEGELVPMLERLGLAFGADTNAETSVHHTMYKLDLPRTDDEVVESSLKILRDIASELTIAPEAVEREKEIIVSEYQVRNTVGQRTGFALLRALLVDDQMADRFVAEPESTRALTAETLRAFYEGYYRPERATLTVVGDFDVAEMEARIRGRFSSWEATGEAREPFKPELVEFGENTITPFVDPANTVSAQLQRVVDFEVPSNSLDGFRTEMLETIASTALSNRLAKLARAEDATTLGGGASALNLVRTTKIYGLSITAKENDWQSALATAEQEWRRAAQYGFTASEVDQAKANLQSSFETAVEKSNSARSASLAYTLAMNSLSDEVRMSPQQRLAAYQQISDTLTPEAVKAAFLAGWAQRPNFTFVTTKEEIEDAQQVIASVLESSTKVAVSAPEETVTKAFAYTDFGTPGTIASDEVIDDLGIRTITFENGVQLNLKITDFEPGSVRVRAEIGTGLSRLTDRPGISVMAQVLAGADDLGEHTAVEINELLAGRQVGYGYSLSSSSVTLSRSTTPKDFELQLQLMAAQVTDTAFSAQAQRQWEGVVPILNTNLRANAESRFGLAWPAVLMDGDPRQGLDDPAKLAELSIADLKDVVGSQFASGPIEIGVVGDFEEDAVIAAVASTFGALDRPAHEQTAVPPLSFRKSREIANVYHNGTAEQGMIAVNWPTTDADDLESELTREMLGRLIQLEALRVLREELGATYTPSSISVASNTYDGIGYISLILPAEPAKMDEVSKIMRDLVSGFADNLADADTMQRARQPILEGYEREEGSNSGWLVLVTNAQSKPEQLDARRTRVEVLSAITPEDVLAEAKKYLTAEPIEMRVIPQPQEEAAE